MKTKEKTFIPMGIILVISVISFVILFLGYININKTTVSLYQDKYTGAMLYEDYNNDGLVSIGDIAVNPKTKYLDQELAIYPYKRVLCIGIDGGGNCLSERAPLYGDIKRPKLSSYERIIERGAITFSAKCGLPSYSAYNWVAILHGIYGNDVEKEYCIDNSIASKKAFVETGKYKSFLKVMKDAFPNRNIASFCTWTPVNVGIVERSIRALGLSTEDDKRTVEEVVKYIKEGKFKNTSAMFIHLNDIDAVGHSKGWFTNAFYVELEKQDKYIGQIMMALEEQTLLDDTLIVLTSDHGGKGSGHGGSDSDTVTTMIALSGVTIDKGRIMNGGENRDVPSMIMAAMSLKGDPTWQGKVFDESIFLKQIELGKKSKREVPTINVKQKRKGYVVTISDIVDKCLTAVQVNLNCYKDFDSKAVAANPGNGFIFLRPNEDKATIVITKEGGFKDGDELFQVEVKDKEKRNIEIDEAMMGDKEGKEYYPNIDVDWYFK